MGYFTYLNVDVLPEVSEVGTTFIVDMSLSSEVLYTQWGLLSHFIFTFFSSSQVYSSILQGHAPQHMPCIDVAYVSSFLIMC